MRNMRVPKIGEKSGRLVVVGREGRSRKMLCRCDCGGEKIVLASVFRSGRVKSCGCLLGAIQPGERYGHLVVLSSCAGYAVCECDCGQTKHVKPQSLRRGATRSCGCLRKQRRSLQAIWAELRKGYGPPVAKEWRNRHALRVFTRWAIDTGWTPGKRLERIDQSGGFTPENCRWI